MHGNMVAEEVSATVASKIAIPSGAQVAIAWVVVGADHGVEVDVESAAWRTVVGRAGVPWQWPTSGSIRGINVSSWCSRGGAAAVSVELL